MDSKLFIEGLQNGDLELIKRVPKADLHNHAGLGMRFKDFQKWCGVELKPPPKIMNGIKGLDDYIGNVTQEYVLSREAFEYSVKATIEAAIEDGVTILETSIDCCNMMYYKNKEVYFSFMKTCVDTYRPKIDFRPEIGVFKGLSEKLWLEYAMPCMESGVFKSIDLYGDESILNLDLYDYYFELCKELGLKTKIHIGEFCDAKQMEFVITELNPDEIQHGIHCIGDSDVVNLIKEREIRLHVCPTSNVVLGAVPSIEKHPINELYEAGLSVTINTDDLLLFDRSVSEEFLYLYQSNVLSAEALDEIRCNGLK